MVFASMTEEDKQAFFALLDEYFSSRPELAEALHAQAGLHGRPNDDAISGPAVRTLATNAFAAQKSTKNSPAMSNPEIASAVGRIAASFNNSSNGDAPSNRPSPPVRRDTFGSSTSPPPPTRANSKPGLGIPAGLVSQRKLGDLDTLWGSRNKDPASPAAAQKAKPAPPPRRGTSPIPPARRGPPPPVRERTPTPEPEPESEPEYDGEWAEALYDYKSTDPNDLQLHAEQRILITARTSDDWWTGEADGRSGLFPAAYVKLL